VCRQQRTRRMQKNASVCCCVVTCDGIILDAHRDDIRSKLTDYVTNYREQLIFFPAKDDRDAQQTFLTSARNTFDHLIIYEVVLPHKTNDDLYTQFHVGTLLRPADRLTLMYAGDTEEDTAYRILRVDWATRDDSQETETGYLTLLKELAETSDVRSDRTGTGTHSVFGRQVRFDLRDGRVPLLTTKKLTWRKVVEELLWFARGETDVRDLQARGVHIWDGNSSRSFLDSVGLPFLAEGDIGAGYGFQWRHFGAQYRGAKAGDYSKYVGEGTDQLANVEALLKEDPFSRRIFMSAWNPQHLDRVALPPCHVSAQFYVSKSEAGLELSCHMYQRSVDTFLGFPWNIASYSMLTHILAARCGMKARELVISTGDTHLYTDHVAAAHKQLQREPRPTPILWISPDIASKDWHEISVHDVDVVGYYPHPFIGAQMSV
jgi:thymidylate synthase